MDLMSLHCSLRLARLFEASGDGDQAAQAYCHYLSETDEQGNADRDDQSGAIRYLAKYYLKQVCLVATHYR